MSRTATQPRRRTRVRIEGTVQGVGFRPYVYRLARELGLGGWVLNDARGVLLEVEGGDRPVARFLERVVCEAPPLAVLERITSDDVQATGTHSFQILPSPRGEVADAPVTADTATCSDCLRELLDPKDRRFRYPFINCTNCGPRFTIVRGVPYDRPLTTMAGFRMCRACQAEYDDPADRRFHAQPNACPQCGPSVKLVDAGGAAIEIGGGWGGARRHQPGDRNSLGRGQDAVQIASGPDSLGRGQDAVQAAVQALRAGAILAVKGVGGFHLACLAGDEAAVARLRVRKRREHKPFAVMAADLAQAGELVLLVPEEQELLVSAARPIVLGRRRPDAAVARAVAPGAPELGVMLPYSPLHHLLLAGAGGALVMTSGNVSDEPIAFQDQDGLARLGQIADLFLIHDRPIETRTDDSVVRRAAGATAFLRRSRGYVPGAIPLPGAGAPRPLLACGAELKNTFCVAKGPRAWVSHHIGDLQNYETLRSFADGVEHFQRLFAVAPEVVAHDLHPEYLSTKYALEREGVELVAVQHHHAHMAACLAEHGAWGRAVGAVFDGTGYGTDGTVWGGELLYGDLRGFTRVGSLYPVRLPGGERAIRQPWRMAAAWLLAAAAGERDPGPDNGSARAPALPIALRGRVDPVAWGQVVAIARSGLASPLTSSVGRLFDAVAALCGVCAEVNYEGQAAIELEAACDPGERGCYPVALTDAGALLVLDPCEMVRTIISDVAAGVEVGTVASRFHGAIVHATVDACTTLAAKLDTETVVLSGGVFANRRLLEGSVCGLSAAGLRVLTPHRLPAGDGGVSYGQAAVAAARVAM